jgi:porphobilinogen synthase
MSLFFILSFMKSLIHRNHRLRRTPSLRYMVSENELNSRDLVMPIFIDQSADERREIVSMPGIYQFPLSQVVEEATDIFGMGIPAVILFGIPSSKDTLGSGAYDGLGVVQEAIRRIKTALPDLVVISDCCLCEYTSDGHCGYHSNGELDNEGTLKSLQKVALSQAKAGADIIAPSGMMDGMVGALREALDKGSFPLIPIMSYAVKYASAFYGPFREAAGSVGDFKGDRKHHQMNPAQRREAFLEVEKDINEGADFIMVKPALSYLDMIRDIREITNVPVVAYNVSGEYSMVKAAQKAGVLDGPAVFEEILLSMKRAGADLIITYYAKEWASRVVM